MELSALKRKSSIALMIGIIVMLVLIPIWYATLVPYILSSEMASNFEHINQIDVMNGYAGGEYIGISVFSVPIEMVTHAYTANVSGAKVTIEADTEAFRTDTINLMSPWSVNQTNPVGSEWLATSAANRFDEYTVVNWTDIEKNGKLSPNDQIEMSGSIENRSYVIKTLQYSTTPGVPTNMSVTNETLPRFAGPTTLVIDKYTGAYWPGSGKKGYATLYPRNLKPGEAINVWDDELNTTGALEFNASVVEQGVTLFRYTMNQTSTEMMSLDGLGTRNVTLHYTEITYIEPTMGVPTYTQNNTFVIYLTTDPSYRLIYLSFADSNASITSGIATAKEAYNGTQILDVYLPTALGAVTAILVVGLTVNIIRIRRKNQPKQQQPQH
jgi:hypothetical protein